MIRAPFSVTSYSNTPSLQAFTPVAILLISWTFRIQEPNKKLAIIVFMISMGVALTSHGEMNFNLFGFLTQAAAVAVRTISRFIRLIHR